MPFVEYCKGSVFCYYFTNLQFFFGLSLWDFRLDIHKHDLSTKIAVFPFLGAVSFRVKSFAIFVRIECK